MYICILPTDPDANYLFVFIWVNLFKGDQADRLLGLTSMCRLRIKIERSHKVSQVAQWDRCQRFGHSSASCHNGVGCVR